MKKISFIAVLITAFAAAAAAGAWASSKEVAKINDSIEVLQQIMSIPESGIPQEILESAQGMAIIPGVIKAGFILGGRYGTGVMSIRGDDGTWSNPSFISIAGGSIGWQVGVQSIDIILVFKSRRGVQNMMRGKFTLGADVGVAAGPVGRRLEAGTDVQLKSEIISYSRTRGLFAGLSLEGATLQVDDSANEYFYGDKARNRDIFADREIATPPAAEKLKEVLRKYTHAPAAAKPAHTETKPEAGTAGEPVKPEAAPAGKSEIKTEGKKE
jgi:lipid-binding SYLF domain-containing protein